MAYRRMPAWGKLIALAGGGAVLAGIGSLYFKSGRELYKNMFNIQTVPSDIRSRCDEAYFTLSNAKDCNSLLKKHLTKPVLDKLKLRKTKMGGTLLDVIRSGVANLDSSIGAYAPDPQSYTTFKELFDPIIEDYHGFKRDEKQPNEDFGENRLGELTNLDPEGKYVLSTRIRCARTVKGFPFNPLLREDDYIVLEQKLKNALHSLPDANLQGTYYPLRGMKQEDKTKLISDHFLFKEGDRFLQAAKACEHWPIGRGIFHNNEKTFLVWVNEEDHVRIISMQKGGDVGAVLRRLITGVKMLEDKVPFARDGRLGFLTFCPTNLGTTIRASVHIKLPKLSRRRDFTDICEKMNLQVRGIHGEHSKGELGVFDISNKRRMGLTEFEAVKQMYDGVKELIRMEESG
uniref:arginine kinase n=1 Tax=Trichuris muris TaxID=70415 RepID=A0A5S6QL07_TRIMR